MNKSIYILIPARGGSERLPGKNMISFCGKPLIWYSISFSNALGLSDQCYVSSDHIEMLNYAELNGAIPMLRPKDLSGSNIKISDVAIHFVRSLHQKGINPEFILLLQPTSPLRTESLFRDMLSVLKNSDSDCIFTVHSSKEKLGEFKDETFKPFNYNLEDQVFSHQGLLAENGTMYLFRVNSLLTTKSLFGEKAIPYKIPSYYRYNDIDDETDLLILEFLYNHLTHTNRIHE